MSDDKLDDLIEAKVKPKVFISYSWSSPGHQQRVRQWAERLMEDGVDVVMDIWDLKEGHDKYSFMERMVTDSGITHVLMMCDKTYAEKANTKKAGVGTETQIISNEVYQKVAQSKFIPIACEFSNDGEPFLPVFLKSRIWIDFSSLEAVNENWERLIRALYGKPTYQKPQLGGSPAYLSSEALSPRRPAIGKFETFKQALLSNKPGLRLYREEFLSACLSYADSLRVREQPSGSSMAERILEDCTKLKAVRDQILDWVLIESGVAITAEFEESLLDCLEKMRELKSRPPEVRAWNDSWFEAESFFVYETFLYIIAALLKARAYAVLHSIFATRYLRPQSEIGRIAFETFGCFYGHAETLQTALQPAPGRGFLSPAAELIRRQADRTDIPFSSVIEAELLVLLMALISHEARWYPQTLHYAERSEFPFFVRAAQHRGFLKLATITGIGDAQSLRETAKAGFGRLSVDQWYDFAMSVPFWECLKMDTLDSIS